jgi:serine protease
MLIGGSDGKVNSPPPAAVMSESIPDEIVVDLKDNATDAQIADLQQSLGVTLRYNSIHSVASKLMVGRVAPADRDQILSRLRANTLVEAAEPEFLYHTDQAAAPAPVSSPAVKGKTFVPNDPDYPRQWHLKLIGMEEAWTRTRGKGATVAVIDTGMGAMSQTGLVEPQDFDQSQLLKGFNFTNNQDLAPDDIGHGTHVTATIAESTDNGVMGAGIAPEAKIMPLRVADAHGMATLANLADAIRYASDHGADVVNLSMSGANYSQIMETAIKDGYKRNVTFVCAAGNSGQEGVEYPAKYQECIGVSAVGPGNLFAYYSTFGKEVDLAAPGGNPRQGEAAMVWQDSIMQKSGFFGPYGPRIDALFPMGGTSSSAPHVAGVAALLVSLGMKDPKEIRSQLRKSAQKYAPADHYGAGVLNAAEAVRTVQKSNRETWIQIGIIVGAAALLLTIGRTLQKPADPLYFVHRLAIALAAGMFLPIVIEKVAGFGSLWNLVGHSVILAVVLLSMPKLGRAGFWQAVAFTAGLMLHLLLDADSGRAPFQVLPQQRILFWLYANVAVGLYFAASAFRASRRNEQQGVRA